MPESKLKECAKKDYVLQCHIQDLERVTEKVKKREEFTKSLAKQCEHHDWISGYIWCLHGRKLISTDDREEMIKDLFQIQEGSL